MAPVVEQDQVELLRTVELAVASGTGDEGRVRGQALAGSAERGLLEQVSEIGPGRDDLVDAHHRDVDPGQRCGHPTVALVRDEHERPRLGDEEVAAADAHVGGEEIRPQLAPREGGQLGRGVAHWRVDGARGGLLVEEGPDLLPGLVRGRHEDVGRTLTGKLDDVLTQVSLADVQPGVFELLVEGDLFGGHRLRLHDSKHAPSPGNVEDVAAHVGRAGGPHHVPAARLDLARQLVEQRVDARQRAPSTNDGTRPHRLGCGVGREGGLLLRRETAGALRHGGPHRRVGESMPPPFRPAGRGRRQLTGHPGPPPGCARCARSRRA